MVNPKLLVERILEEYRIVPNHDARSFESSTKTKKRCPLVRSLSGEYKGMKRAFFIFQKGYHSNVEWCTQFKIYEVQSLKFGARYILWGNVFVECGDDLWS